MLFIHSNVKSAYNQYILIYLFKKELKAVGRLHQNSIFY